MDTEPKSFEEGVMSWWNAVADGAEASEAARQTMKQTYAKADTKAAINEATTSVATTSVLDAGVIEID